MQNISKRRLDLLRKVDLSLYRQLPYVVENPSMPDNLLYLTRGDYLDLVKVALSNQIILYSVAMPGDEDLVKRALASSPVSSTSLPEGGPPKVLPRMFRFLLFCDKIPPKRYYDLIFRSDYLSNPMYKLVGLGGETSTMVTPEGKSFSSLLRTWSLQLYTWAGLSFHLTEIRLYTAFLLRLLQTQGSLGLIKYMKSSLFAINSYLAGSPVKDTRAIGALVGLRNGLPSHLPASIRRLIRSRNFLVIRVWVSILNSFKALQAPYPIPTYSTILTPPLTRGPEWEAVLSEYAPYFWEHLRNHYSIKSLSFSGNANLQPLASFSSGPNLSTAIAAFGQDAQAWVTAGLDHLLRRWLFETGQTNLLNLFVSSCARAVPQLLSSHPDLFKLGKLSLKFEAAGKVRVFAIVDIWTQSALKFFHSYLFSVLRLMPMDGTFDQDRAIHTLAAKNIKDHNGFDLSAATDTIPKELYVSLFTPILGRNLTLLWWDILTAREFATPDLTSPAYSNHFSEGDLEKWKETRKRSIRYSRGQPMGALSSWAALAIAHHFLVFISAVRSSGLSPSTYVLLGLRFEDYRVLGDDLDLCGQDISREYLDLTDGLEIPINVKKSILSKIGFINFANQSWLGLINLSPISLKEELSILAAGSRFELFRRLLLRCVISSKVVPEWIRRSRDLGYLITSTKLGDIIRGILPRRMFHAWASLRRFGIIPPLLRSALIQLLFPTRSMLLDFSRNNRAIGLWVLLVGKLGSFAALETFIGDTSPLSQRFWARTYPIMEPYYRVLSFILVDKILDRLESTSRILPDFYPWLKDLCKSEVIDPATCLPTAHAYVDLVSKQVAQTEEILNGLRALFPLHEREDPMAYCAPAPRDELDGLYMGYRFCRKAVVKASHISYQTRHEAQWARILDLTDLLQSFSAILDFTLESGNSYISFEETGHAVPVVKQREAPNASVFKGEALLSQLFMEAMDSLQDPSAMMRFSDKGFLRQRDDAVQRRKNQLIADLRRSKEDLVEINSWLTKYITWDAMNLTSTWACHIIGSGRLMVPYRAPSTLPSLFAAHWRTENYQSWLDPQRWGVSQPPGGFWTPYYTTSLFRNPSVFKPTTVGPHNQIGQILRQFENITWVSQMTKYVPYNKLFPNLSIFGYK